MHPPLVLVAHGSRDPRAAAATRALSRAVAAARPGLDVHAAYLDHAGPRPGEVLTALDAAGHDRVILVPLLLTAAYHGRVDIPGAVAAARADGLTADVTVTDVLGPDHPALTAGLRHRLTGSLAGGSCDAVVLAAAGTRSPTARAGVERAADALGAALGVPCAAAYASAAPPEPGDAVRALRAAGARRVAVAAYFLAPGTLYDAAVASASAAGAVAAARPLGDSPELVAVVLDRFDAVRRTTGAIAYAA